MGLFDFFKKKETREKEKAQEYERVLAKFIEYADLFVSNNADKFSGLDFSVESLIAVDDILEEASNFYNEMSEDEKLKLIRTTGCYIAEVARRNFGGKYYWDRHLEQPIFITGEPEFEVMILPLDKVRGRLENGQEDNIPFYFEGYIEQVQKKGVATIV